LVSNDDAFSACGSRARGRGRGRQFIPPIVLVVVLVLVLECLPIMLNFEFWLLYLSIRIPHSEIRNPFTF
jgi:hypothetical protein